MSAEEEGAGALAGLILDLETERQAEGDEHAHEPVDVLPGVGGPEVSTRQALQAGGRATLVVLALLVGLDELAATAMNILAPEVARTLDISAAAVVALCAASGIVVVLASLPMGWLADRRRRAPVIGWAGLVFAVLVAVAGVASTSLTAFAARFGLGAAQAEDLPVQGSLMADQYAVRARGRLWAYRSMAGRLGVALGPFVVAAVTTVITGRHGWQWVFLVIAVPAGVVAVIALRLPEPQRGQQENQDIFGPDDRDQLEPLAPDAALPQLARIATLRASIVALAAIGFGMFSVPVLASVYLSQHYGQGAFGRGLSLAVGALAALVAMPFAGHAYDRLYRADPVRAFRLFGLLVLVAAVFTPVQYAMPNALLFTVLGIPTAALLGASFVMVTPLVTSVVPYRLRGMGAGLAAIYLYGVGAAGGGLVAAMVVSASGPRPAVLIILLPATVLGGVLVLRRAGAIADDLTRTTIDIREEHEERDRQRDHPEDLPALQVRHLDFSYGHVQILFDVGFEVRHGEVLALLGSNGAGKTTLLRVIAGLGTPSRGLVRLNGRSVTHVTPEARTRLGIHMLPGGNGVFRDMTVRENLEMAVYNHRRDRPDMERRIQASLDLFPELATRSGELASALSGGQQQLMALARTLACEPEILIIDELSLGLAPIMVERLVATLEELKAQGMTIIVVEQSLNVAMAIAERAVFLEKGSVRFDGPTAELVERDDLARAMFLGAEGG